MEELSVSVCKRIPSVDFERNGWAASLQVKVGKLATRRRSKTLEKSERVRVFVTGLRGIPGVMGGVESHCEEILPRIARLDADMDVEVLARRPYMPTKIADFEGVRIT